MYFAALQWWVQWRHTWSIEKLKQPRKCIELIPYMKDKNYSLHKYSSLSSRAGRYIIIWFFISVNIDIYLDIDQITISPTLTASFLLWSEMWRYHRSVLGLPSKCWEGERERRDGAILIIIDFSYFLSEHRWNDVSTLLSTMSYMSIEGRCCRDIYWYRFVAQPYLQDIIF